MKYLESLRYATRLSWVAIVSIALWACLGQTLYSKSGSLIGITTVLGLVYTIFIPFGLRQWPSAELWIKMDRTLSQLFKLSAITFLVAAVVAIASSYLAELKILSLWLIVVWQLSRLTTLLTAAMLIPLRGNIKTNPKA